MLNKKIDVENETHFEKMWDENEKRYNTAFRRWFGLPVIFAMVMTMFWMIWQVNTVGAVGTREVMVVGIPYAIVVAMLFQFVGLRVYYKEKDYLKEKKNEYQGLGHDRENTKKEFLKNLQENRPSKTNKTLKSKFDFFVKILKMQDVESWLLPRDFRLLSFNDRETLRRRTCIEFNIGSIMIMVLAMICVMAMEMSKIMFQNNLCVYLVVVVIQALLMVLTLVFGIISVRIGLWISQRSVAT